MKYRKILIILLAIFSFTYCNVFAANESNSTQSTQAATNSDETVGEYEPYYGDENCTDLAPALRIGYLIITLVRVVIPLIIIVMGTFKLFSTVLAGTADSLGKTAIDLFKRVIIAALIFFTPSIINTFMRVMTTDTNSDVNVCRSCLFENNCPAVDIVSND